MTMKFIGTRTNNIINNIKLKKIHIAISFFQL